MLTPTSLAYNCDLSRLAVFIPTAKVELWMLSTIQPAENTRLPSTLAASVAKIAGSSTSDKASFASAQESITCIICLQGNSESLKDHSEKMEQLPCEHRFHEACIRKWLTQHQNKHNGCPVCRDGKPEPDAPARLSSLRTDRQSTHISPPVSETQREQNAVEQIYRLTGCKPLLTSNASLAGALALAPISGTVVSLAVLFAGSQIKPLKKEGIYFLAAFTGIGCAVCLSIAVYMKRAQIKAKAIDRLQGIASQANPQLRADVENARSASHSDRQT